MVKPSPEFQHWQRYVQLFERATHFVDTHAISPSDPVPDLLHTGDSPLHIDERRSYMVAIGRLSLNEKFNWQQDRLCDVTITRQIRNLWIPDGHLSGYEKLAYSESVRIGTYTAEELPMPIQDYGIGFDDHQWGDDYRSLHVVDSPTPGELPVNAVSVKEMNSCLFGHSVPMMRTLLANIIYAAHRSPQMFEQYPRN